jgi:hypothetical protein
MNNYTHAADGFGGLMRYGDLRDQIEQANAIRGAVDVQKRLAESDVVRRFADAQKQVAESDLLRSSLGASSTFANLTQRVREDKDRWDQITRSFDDEKTIRSLPAPIKIPSFADHLERALNARASKDRAIHDQQFQLLSSIAEAGKKQNETMAAIASLQGMLVKEALENTRIQRVLSSILQRLALPLPSLPSLSNKQHTMAKHRARRMG